MPGWLATRFQSCIARRLHQAPRKNDRRKKQWFGDASKVGLLSAVFGSKPVNAFSSVVFSRSTHHHFKTDCRLSRDHEMFEKQFERVRPISLNKVRARRGILPSHRQDMRVISSGCKLVVKQFRRLVV